MPEYLAPGVYVEEIDTGNKPIEGVSTSTAGMIGVTERGPVNVPILITGTGEFNRWFGGLLNRVDFGDNCYLPHAVEGFFTNLGKRVYVTRILSTDAAAAAKTPLFLQENGIPTATLLTRAPKSESNVFIVWPNGIGPIAVNDWVRIGTGTDAEYRQAGAVPAIATTGIVIDLPLVKSHATTNNVEHYTNLPSVDVSLKLVGSHNAGATSLTLTGAGAAVTVDRLVQIVNAVPLGTGEELIFIRNAVDLGSGNWRIELETPLQFGREDGALVNVQKALTAPAPVDVTQLQRDAVGSDTALEVASNAVFAEDQYVRIVEGTRGEFRRIGSVHAVTFGVPLSYALTGGAYVEHVTTSDDGGISSKTLNAPVRAGAMALPVNDRQKLSIGQVLRVGAVNDPDVEYVVIRDLPNSAGTGPDPGRIVLETPLARAHGGTSSASLNIIVAQSNPVPTKAATLIHGLDVSATVALISGSLLPGTPTPSDLVRITVPGTMTVYLRVAANSALVVQILKLNAPLQQPHSAPQPVIKRQELLTVFALDPGEWGNRLRVSASSETTPLVRTRIRKDASGIQDPTHIRLESASGVEIGTVLSLASDRGDPFDTSFKVEGIDRQNGYLLSLNTAIPASAALGTSVVSIEFSLSVILLRQPDPVQPSRNNQVLNFETFRNLSLDDRHSRYIHRVIGTTWVAGASTDLDGRALRLEDRRSEGDSAYVRVRDNAAGNNTALRQLRLGPEFLVDVSNGQQIPARISLNDGDDQIAALTDNDFVGQDDPNPENRTGLNSLRNVEEISIVACPGYTSVTIQNALINHCELMRYRFTVLDGPRPPDDSLADVQFQRQQFDTKYAALYHPWLLIPDPYPTNTTTVKLYPIPPSGHVVGVYARTDIERGVHKAPANELVRGISGLQRLLNKEEQDILNPYPVNINVIRDFRDNDRGIRVYGGRVITSDSDWKYVNVRRLLIFIEASIDRGLQWAVFEPNAEALWGRVRRSISNFLTLVWRNGGLEGTKPEEAYFVKCDRTTMTQTDIDSGRLIVVIGVAPVKPAEYVIIRIGLWTAHAED